MNNTEFQDTIEIGDRVKLSKHSNHLRKFHGYKHCNHIPGCVGCKGYIIVETDEGYNTSGCFRNSSNGVLQIRAEIFKNLLSDEDFAL